MAPTFQIILLIYHSYNQNYHCVINCYYLSAAAGLAPLAMRVSEANLRLSGAMGAGLLIGTALAVVIPEGFEAFHTAVDDSLGALLQCLGNQYSK